MPNAHGCGGVWVLVVALLCPLSAEGQEGREGLEEEIRYLKAESLVLTATRTLERAERSGATIHVITRDRLERMGARNLIDALRIVPGLGITRNFVGAYEIEVRGIKTLFSEKVLIMVDSHPINLQLTNGGTNWGFGPVDIDHIQRIEVILGPGSALYGANAFLAIVNMITVDAKEEKDLRLEVSGGSYATQSYGAVIARSTPSLDLLAAAKFYSTDGDRGFVEKENPLSPLGSGSTLDTQERYRGDLKLRSGPFAFRGAFARRRAGPYVGAANALNDESRQRYGEFFLDARYALSRNRLHIEPRLFYDHSVFDNYWELFSEGVFGGLFPDGMLLRAKARTTTAGVEVTGDYEASRRHHLVFGAIGERQRQSDVQSWQNYDSRTYAPLPGGYQETSGRSDLVWAPEATRWMWGAFIEEIFDPRDDVRVIVGARYDHYNDSGGSLNPRVSVVLSPGGHTTLKALYGSAFRAPTFGELHNKNNPVVLGNPDLKPEKIRTVEVGATREIGTHLSLHLTGFMNDIRDLIVAGNPNINAGKARVFGAETEARYTLREGTSLAIRYAVRDAENRITYQPIPDTPRQRFGITGEVALTSDLDLWADVDVRGDSSRESADSRPGLPSRTLVDTTLAWRNVFGFRSLSLRLSVFNLFNVDQVDPSPIGTIVSDYPREARNFLVTVVASLP